MSRELCQGKAHMVENREASGQHPERTWGLQSIAHEEPNLAKNHMSLEAYTHPMEPLGETTAPADTAIVAL